MPPNITAVPEVAVNVHLLKCVIFSTCASCVVEARDTLQSQSNSRAMRDVERERWVVLCGEMRNTISQG